VSTRVTGATVLVLVTARATLSAGTEHLVLSVSEGPAPGNWRYNLGDATGHHMAYGRITEMTDHLDALRYAAGSCARGYEPGTVARGMLEQFAAEHKK
jgi:hypothetical protein